MTTIFPDGPLLTKQQLASRLNLSLSTIDARLSSGAISHYKLGRRVLFGPSHVEAMLAKAEVRSKTENFDGAVPPKARLDSAI